MLIESLPDRVFVKDTEGRYLLNNAEHLRLLGAAMQEEVAGKTDFDFLPAELAERYRAEDQRIVETGRALLDQEETLVDEAGNERCLSTTRVPLRGEGEEVLGILGVTRDITEGKRAEEALRRSEERLSSLIQNVSDIVAIMDADGTVRYDNPALERVLGYDPADRVGGSAFEYVHPEDRKRAEEALARALEKPGVQPPLQMRVRHADGSYRHLETIRNNLLDDPSVRGIVSIARDITDRKKSEDALRESEERFRALVQNSYDVLAVLEEDGTSRYISPSLERVLGHKVEDRVGKNAFGSSIIHPDDLELARDEFATLAGTPGGIATAEFRMLHADGTVKHVEATGRNLLDDPRVGGIVVNYWDVTERRQAEIDSREAEKKYRDIFENAVEGIFQSTITGRFISVNPALARMFGYGSPEEMVSALTSIGGQFYADPDRRDEFSRLMGEHGMVSEFEYRARRKDGSTVWISENARLVRDAGGEPLYYEGFIEDITERKEAEADLRKSRARLRTVLDRTATGVALVDAEGHLVESNPALQEMLGFGGEELRGKHFSDMTHPDDVEEDAKLFGELVAGGLDHFRLHKRYVRKDGSVMWGRLTSSAVRDAEGEPWFMIGMVEDITQYKATAEEVERLGRRNELILNSVGEGIYGLDLEGRATFVNPAAVSLTGYSAGELLGERQHALIHHSHADGTPYPGKECPIYAPLVDGKVHHVDDEVFWRKDGTSFPVEYVSTPMLEAGVVTGAVVAFRDVTQRREAEGALKESEERYRAVVEQSVEAIYLYDVQTRRVLESNPAFQMLVGYTAEELLGMEIYDFIAHEKEDVDRNIALSLQEERRIIGERDYRRKDGSVFVVETSASVIRYRGRRAICAVSRDLTERKEAEEALRRSEERFRSLVRNAPDIITVLDAENVIHYDSPSIERVLGYKPEERLGTKGSDYLHPEEREWGIERFADLVNRSETGVTLEYRLRHADGSWRHVEARRTNLLDDPAVRGVVVNYRDVTERKEAETRLREAETRYRTLVEQIPAVTYVKGASDPSNPAVREPADEEAARVHARGTDLGPGSLDKDAIIPTTASACWPSASVSSRPASRSVPSIARSPRTAARCGCATRPCWCATRMAIPFTGRAS